jgi:hypothetical protein
MAHGKDDSQEEKISLRQRYTSLPLGHSRKIRRSIREDPLSTMTPLRHGNTFSPRAATEKTTGTRKIRRPRRENLFSTTAHGRHDDLHDDLRNFFFFTLSLFLSSHRYNTDLRSRDET